MADTKIGGAYIEIEARGAGQARAEIDSTKSSLQEFAESTNKGLGRQVELFTSLIGKITAVIGVATTFYQLGRRISTELFGDDGSLTKGIDQTIARGTERFRKELEETEKSLSKIEARVNARQRLGVAASILSLTSQAEDDVSLETLRERAVDLRARIRQDEINEATKTADDKANAEVEARIKVLRARADELTLSGLDPLEADRVRLIIEMQDAREELARASSQALREQLQANLGFLDGAITRVRNQQAESEAAAKKMDQERLKAAEERAKREAEVYAKALEDNLRNLKGLQIGDFGAERLISAVAVIQNRLDALVLQRR